MVAGFSVFGGTAAVAAEISGAVGSAGAACTVVTDGGLTAGGAEVGDGALELACEQLLVNESVANAAPRNKNLEMEVFIDVPMFRTLLTITIALTVLAAGVFKRLKTIASPPVLRPFTSRMKLMPH
jgi:hypothetical protein